MRRQREVTHWWWDLNHWLSLYLNSEHSFATTMSTDWIEFRYLQTIQDNYVSLTCFSSYFCSCFIYLFSFVLFFLVYIFTLYHWKISITIYFTISLNNYYAISTTFHTYTTTTLQNNKMSLFNARPEGNIMNTQTQYSLIGKFSQYFLLLSRIINAQTHVYVYKFIIRHHIVLLFIVKIVLFFSCALTFSSSLISQLPECIFVSQCLCDKHYLRPPH